MAFGDSSYIPTSSTVLYYKMNGGATDSSTSGNNGTATNVTYINGRNAQAASFNGTNSYIQTTSATPGTTSATYSVWVKRATATNGGLFSDNVYPVGSACAIDNGSSYLFYIFGSSNIITTTNLPPVGVWTLVTCTHSGTTGAIYINGLLQVSGTVNAKTSSGTSLIVGALGPAIYNLDGQLDDMIVENRAWTAKEIQQYYSNAIGRYQTIII